MVWNSGVVAGWQTISWHCYFSHLSEVFIWAWIGKNRAVTNKICLNTTHWAEKGKQERKLYLLQAEKGKSRSIYEPGNLSVKSSGSHNGGKMDEKPIVRVAWQVEPRNQWGGGKPHIQQCGTDEPQDLNVWAQWKFHLTSGSVNVLEFRKLTWNNKWELACQYYSVRHLERGKEAFNQSRW